MNLPICNVKDAISIFIQHISINTHTAVTVQTAIKQQYVKVMKHNVPHDNEIINFSPPKEVSTYTKGSPAVCTGTMLHT